MPVSLILPWPPSVNRYWRQFRGRAILSAEGRTYRQAVLGILDGFEPMEGRLAVSVVAFPPDRRRRDLDNMLKAPLDALTHAGVWRDDEQLDVIAIMRGDVVKGGLLAMEVSVLTDDEKRRLSAALRPMRSVCDSRSARIYGLDARTCGRCVLWVESAASFPYGECGRGQRLATEACCESFMAKGKE